MGLLEKVKRHWVTATMYLVFSMFFLGACMVSANTYGAIAQAQRDISIEDPARAAVIVEHGNLNLSFSIQLHNPSRYTLHVYTQSWYVTLHNQSGTSSGTIPLGEDYVGPTRYLEVPAKSTVNYTFWSVVSDRDTLAKLFGFINYSRGTGVDYTLETLPYQHEFSVMLFIGEFDHEYLREGYLNSLVTVNLTYSSAEVAA